MDTTIPMTLCQANATRQTIADMTIARIAALWCIAMDATMTAMGTRFALSVSNFRMNKIMVHNDSKMPVRTVFR